MQILCKECPCKKEEANFLKLWYILCIGRRCKVGYNGCKKSVRMKLKIHGVSNEESDVLSVYRRQEWGYRPRTFCKMNPLNPLRFYHSPEKLRQTKSLLFNFWVIKFTVIPKKAIWYLAIWQNWCFGQFFHPKNWKVNTWFVSVYLVRGKIWEDWEDSIFRKFGP